MEYEIILNKLIKYLPEIKTHYGKHGDNKNLENLQRKFKMYHKLQDA